MHIEYYYSLHDCHSKGEEVLRLRPYRCDNQCGITPDRDMFTINYSEYMIDEVMDIAPYDWQIKKSWVQEDSETVEYRNEMLEKGNKKYNGYVHKDDGVSEFNYWKYDDGTDDYDVMTWEYIVQEGINEDWTWHFFNMKSAWEFVYHEIRRKDASKMSLRVVPPIKRS